MLSVSNKTKASSFKADNIFFLLCNNVHNNLSEIKVCPFHLEHLLQLFAYNILDCPTDNCHFCLADGLLSSATRTTVSQAEHMTVLSASDYCLNCLSNRQLPCPCPCHVSPAHTNLTLISRILSCPSIVQEKTAFYSLLQLLVSFVCSRMCGHMEV